jgi:hypothetical protein
LRHAVEISRPSLCLPTVGGSNRSHRRLIVPVIDTLARLSIYAIGVPASPLSLRLRSPGTALEPSSNRGTDVPNELRGVQPHPVVLATEAL